MPRTIDRTETATSRKIKQAQTLAASKEPLERIVALTGLSPYVAGLAMRTEKIQRIVEEDGKAEHNETVRQSRSRRERRIAAEKPTLAEIRQKAREA